MDASAGQISWWLSFVYTAVAGFYIPAARLATTRLGFPNKILITASCGQTQQISNPKTPWRLLLWVE